MGITDFHKIILKKNHPQCITDSSGDKIYHFEHVYIDLNFILHSCVHIYNKSYKDFIRAVYKIIDTFLMKYMPTRSLNIMMDGVASYAKILLMRTRRFDMEYDDKTISGVDFTPGTKIMNEIESDIKKYLKIYRENSKMRKIKTHLSSFTEPNEGEIKIFKHI